MIITDFLEKNARIFPNDVALTEINPGFQPKHAVTWREYHLIESTVGEQYHRNINWREFNEMSNRFANLLLTRGVKKGDKVAILLMNCIEWLPIYFGILKTGALAVPLNFRYTSEEIDYCLNLSDSSVLIFGPEFIGRIEPIVGKNSDIEHMFYVGKDTPVFADNYDSFATYCSKTAPPIELKPEDDAAIYFSSGTTGFPKAILHSHQALVSACETEQRHHHQCREDIFLCMPPLYHTGAKMHWFGSLMSCSGAILLKGIRPDWILRTISDEGATIVCKWTIINSL